MTTQPPTRPAYPLPDGRAISTAAHEALEVARKANERLGRAMAVTVAAAVRDILTDCDHEAPFDAAGLELVEDDGATLHATGRYWTADGEARDFATTPGVDDGQFGVFEMNEWVNYLGDSNWEVWRPLCTSEPDREGRSVWRLDLAKAAALPLD
ncbi:hypothetical protein OV450_1382 [Actinobacteria bacterium OV450]|nr:hypothetical protein OV450_1382 [Actinobacteria bacterium OV450]